MVHRFAGKTVIVTGAAGGIGRATAARLASEGASIVAVDLPGSPLDATVEAVHAAGSTAIKVPADVGQRDQVQSYLGAALDRFGRVDGLFNNAGIEGAVSPLVDYSESEWDRVQTVNVKGVLFGLQVVGRYMRANHGGAIVNSGSILGIRSGPGMAAYAASKAAVMSLTRTAAMEFAPDGVRVNAIAPAPIATRMLEALERQIRPENPQALRDAMAGRSPLGRVGEPGDVAGVVAFLLSDDASYISGAVLGIDGGLAAR